MSCYTLTQRIVYVLVRKRMHTHTNFDCWSTSICNYQMRRKHLYFLNGSHLSKGEKVHLQDLTSKFLLISPLHMNKNNGRSSKQEENKADRKREVPSRQGGTKMGHKTPNSSP